MFLDRIAEHLSEPVTPIVQRYSQEKFEGFLPLASKESFSARRNFWGK